MSDDGDELGGLAPTTPAARVKKSTVRTTKPNSRTEAGPSSKPKTGRKNTAVPVSDHSDVEEVHPFDISPLDDDDDEHIATPVQPRRADRKGQAMRAEAPVTNGKATAKAKGKAKATQPKLSQKRGAPEPMDIDPIEVLDEPDEQGGAAELADAINTAGRSKRTNPVVARPGKRDEVAKMAEQLRRMEDQVATLSRQLEEAFHIRETEAERLLKQSQAQYESEMQAREHHTQELLSKERLMHTGNATVLNLLTREDAEEEKQSIQKEVSSWRDLANEKQRAIEQRDERIALLEQREKDLRFELDAEINRSAALAKSNRNPSSVLRGGGRPGGVDDPRHAEVLRFYEDLSNLLVPNMKTQPGNYLDLEDWVLSCIYTFNDDDAEDQHGALRKSLSFTLRFCYEPPDAHASELITSKDQLVPTVHFTPLDLDKESPEFVERLDFLGAPFSFGRNQLPLFLRTIYQRMNEAVLGDDDEDSVQIVEMARS